MRFKITTTIVLCGALGASSSAVRAAFTGEPAAAVEVFATGLDNPRGLAFGPDGHLYVAEAGYGGTQSTADVCPELQIGPPFGPYTNGPTARISRIDPHGVRTTLVDGLPSGQSQFPDWQGVADVVFAGRKLFAMVQGGGCSYGSDVAKSVIEVDTNTGEWRQVADLGAFRRAHPSSLPDDDLEPEGVFFNIEIAQGRLFALDVNSGALLSVDAHGTVRTVVDVAAQFGHITPTALATRGGHLFIGNIFEFPIVDGASKIFKVNLATGRMTAVADGFTAINGLAFDRHGRLYVLEMGNGQGSGFPDPGAGRVLRVDDSGHREVIVDGLTFPTGITIGPDGRLYISNRGFDIPPIGTGEILAVDVSLREP